MPDPVRRRHRGTAIISDDDEFFRVALRSVLRERNGFSDVIETGSFDEAVEALGKTGPVAMGLFDLNMVGMENWLDLSAVRGEYPSMQLVVVSASRRREDILRTLEIGAHGFVHKGLGISELTRAIDLISDGQVYVPPFLPDVAVAGPQLDFASDDEGEQLPARSGHAVPDATNGQGKPATGGRQLVCSPRQREIIDLLIAGNSNKGMARALNLSEGTIKFHMAAVMRLLGANSRVEAATRAMKQMSG